MQVEAAVLRRHDGREVPGPEVHHGGHRDRLARLAPHEPMRGPRLARQRRDLRQTRAVRADPEPAQRLRLRRAAPTRDEEASQGEGPAIEQVARILGDEIQGLAGDLDLLRRRAGDGPRPDLREQGRQGVAVPEGGEEERQFPDGAVHERPRLRILRRASEPPGRAPSRPGPRHVAVMAIGQADIEPERGRPAAVRVRIQEGFEGREVVHLGPRAKACQRGREVLVLGGGRRSRPDQRLGQLDDCKAECIGPLSLGPRGHDARRCDPDDQPSRQKSNPLSPGPHASKYAHGCLPRLRTLRLPYGSH